MGKKIAKFFFPVLFSLLDCKYQIKTLTRTIVVSFLSSFSFCKYIYFFFVLTKLTTFSVRRSTNSENPFEASAAQMNFSLVRLIEFALINRGGDRLTLRPPQKT